MLPSVSFNPIGRPRVAHRTTLLLLSGLFFCVPPGTPLAAQERVANESIGRDPIDAHVAEAVQRFGIPARWIRAVMRVESGGDRKAVSPKGAMGLMQIMPATWSYLTARHALGNDPFDPHANILAGAAYLRELHDRYGTPGFLAAYNAGPGRYEASLSGRPLPTETIAYVAALAPAIDGRAAPDAARLTASDSQAWRSASLFAVRTVEGSADRQVQPEQERAVVPNAAMARDVSAIVPQGGGLFVTRGAGGEVR